MLRKFNTLCLLDRNVDPTEVDLMQSRNVKERVLFEHYIADHERCLRLVFEQYAPRVFLSAEPWAAHRYILALNSIFSFSVLFHYPRGV